MRGLESFPKGTLMVHVLHCSMDTKEGDINDVGKLAIPF